LLLDRERERIASVLHDGVEQEIFTIGVRLTALLEDGAVEPRLAHELRELRRLSIAAADGVRRAIFSLTDPHHEGTLTDDVRSILRELERRSDVQVHLAVSGTPGPAVETIRDVVDVVVKEALSNVLKHTSATLVLVNLLYQPDHLDLAVHDNGPGAPEIVLGTYPVSSLRFGLRHSRRLVLDRGGSFAVVNGQEGGLVIRVGLPLPEVQP
jgi:NarL family two-component system sensor histidine kinase LiaS